MPESWAGVKSVDLYEVSISFAGTGFKCGPGNGTVLGGDIERPFNVIDHNGLDILDRFIVGRRKDFLKGGQFALEFRLGNTVLGHIVDLCEAKACGEAGYGQHKYKA